MQKNDPKQCASTKHDGKRCNAWAMENSDFCFTHSPETEKQRKEAVSKGGKGNRKNYGPLEIIEIKNNRDIVRLISKTINEVRQGLVEVRIANCIFYGSGQLLKALEVAELEERVVRIEEILSNKK